MPNLEFSAPYNEDPACLEELFRLKQVGDNRIREVFLSGPQEFAASGRVMDTLTLEDFLATVDRIHGEGLQVNLIMNPTCEGAEWYSSDTLKKVLEYLTLAHEEHDVETVTIANPLYVQQVRKYLPDINICASVLGDIDCLERAVIFARLGANIITPDVSINRDLELLAEIKQVTGAEIKLMVNEGCLHKCPFRKFHFNYVSHQSKKSGRESMFVPYCHQVIGDDPANILKSGWVRPEDAHKYGEVTTYFKIVGRELPKSKYLRVIRAYLEESWEGDLFDVLCSSLGAYGLKHGAYLDNKTLGEMGFFESVANCGRRCSQCGYCDEVVKKLLSLGGFTEEKMEDKGLAGRLDDLEEAGVLTRHEPGEAGA